jgi:flagellar hook-length control protein FliK
MRFRIDAEITDKSSGISINDMSFLSVDDENVSTGVDYSSANISPFVNEVIGDLSADNENNDLDADKPNELIHSGNADYTPKTGKDFWKQNQRITSKLGERVSKLSVEVQPKVQEEISAQANSPETEAAAKMPNDEYYSQNHVSNGMEYKNLSGNQYKVDLGSEVKKSANDFDANNELNDANNEINKEMSAKRTEFLSFMHKISEQNSLLSEKKKKNILKSQQMNLLNKGRFAFSEGVENVVRFIRTENLAKAVLIVDPPALGRVNIELISTDNGIEAILRVSNEQIKMLVQEESAQLKRDLEQIGVTLTEFSVDVQNDGNRSRNQSFNNHRSRRMAHLGSAEGENEDERVEIFRVDLRKGLLHWIA